MKTPWKRINKTNILVLTKTPSEIEHERRPQYVFKTSSSRLMFAGLFLQACNIFFHTSLFTELNSSPSKFPGGFHLKQNQVFPCLSIPHIKSWKILFSYQFKEGFPCINFLIFPRNISKAIVISDLHLLLSVWVRRVWMFFGRCCLTWNRNIARNIAYLYSINVFASWMSTGEVFS